MLAHTRLALFLAAGVTLFAAVDALSQRSTSLGFASPFTSSVSSFLGRVSEGSCISSSRAEKLAVRMAHHPNPKGAKKYEKNRPRKHSLADINRKPPPYAVDTMAQARQKLPEFTVIGQADMTKFVKVTKADGTTFFHTKAPFTQA